jgi:hypothetical protein
LRLLTHISEGAVATLLPGSGIGDYLRTAETLLQRLPEGVVLLTAHRATPPRAPLMRYGDLVDLHTTLREIRAGTRSGEGFFPRVYRVNDGLVLFTDFPWAESWE